LKTGRDAEEYIQYQRWKGKGEKSWGKTALSEGWRKTINKKWRER
jgi:hypothetical protein